MFFSEMKLCGLYFMVSRVFSEKSILNQQSLLFLEKYLNNASPTGYEWEGQKMWMDYLKPYVDEFITDTYGSAVAVINPEAEYKVVIEGHADEKENFIYETAPQ